MSLDGIEGNYSRELAISYSDYDHIVVSYLPCFIFRCTIVVVSVNSAPLSPVPQKCRNYCIGRRALAAWSLTSRICHHFLHCQHLLVSALTGAS